MVSNANVSRCSSGRSLVGTYGTTAVTTSNGPVSPSNRSPTRASTPFARAHATHSGSRSVASIRASRSAISTAAIAPEPVHRSIPVPPRGIRSTARHATDSVCQRGT